MIVPKFAKKRNSKGASIFLIIGVAVLLAFLVFLGFQYMLLTGGSREVRNGVDASVLNVAKNVIGVKVSVPPEFVDCADSSGTVGMSTINRVWGKAYLISANAEEMKQQGLSTGKAQGNADMAYGLASRVNTSLYEGVTNKVRLDSFFANISEKRSAGLLGEGTTVVHDSDSSYPTAMVDRGAESNIVFRKGQLPITAKLPQAGQYIAGYAPFKTNNRDFCFTTFRANEQPHLISDTYFDSNRPSIGGASLAVPNAFQGRGTAYGATGTITATASAVANPQRAYQLAIPKSFCFVYFQNRCNVYIEGKKTKQIQYSCRPLTYTLAQDVQLNPKGPYAGLTLNGWGELGQEFTPNTAPNLWALLNVLPPNHVPALQRMAQRLQEVDPNFSMNQLAGLLQRQSTVPGIDTYLIFPRYSMPDFTNPTIDMAPLGSQKIPQWLNQVAKPEGTQTIVLQENMVKNQPNWCRDYVFPTPPTLPHHSECSGTVQWYPGTGMMQCLGELYVDRRTDCYFAEPPGAGGAGGNPGAAGGGGNPTAAGS